MQTMPVSAVMTKDVVSITPDLRVDDALELMGANDVRRLPVLSSTGRMVGIITREDARVALEKARCEHTVTPDFPKVREVMSDYVYTVAPDDSIAVAAQLMVGHGIGAVPVVEGRELVGIVTESDIFKYLAEKMEGAEKD